MNDVATPATEGSTLIDLDEREGLLPTWVATRQDLDTAEQSNISKALSRLRRRRLTTAEILDDAFVRWLHAAMFGDVWSWAGKYRLTERNIGIDPITVSIAVRDLMADGALWLSADAQWISLDQAACRIHHRLVQIHPFPNGNGRLARAHSDLLIRSLGAQPLTWGQGSNLREATPDRIAYIQALRKADSDPGDIDDLVSFARS